MNSIGNDKAIRTSIVWLAMLIVVVGIWTWSLKKMMVTYVVGMLLICGLLLPDWDFFDRHYSRWRFPITSQERATLLAQRSASNRYRIYPIRLICYTAIYGFTLYKWWMFITS